MDALKDGTTTPLGGEGVDLKQVGIYLNRSAVPDNRTSLTDENDIWHSRVNNQPQIYRVDNVNASPDAVLGEHTWDRFSTDILIRENTTGPANPWREPMFGYPWDIWEGSMVFTANDLTKATTENLPNSYVVPIVNAALVTGTCKWNSTTIFTKYCNLCYSRLTLVNWRIKVDETKTINTCTAGGDSGCELVSPRLC
jgi:hypothetical protein